jgi:hypothetical protein
MGSYQMFRNDSFVGLNDGPAISIDSSIIEGPPSIGIPAH